MPSWLEVSLVFLGEFRRSFPAADFRRDRRLREPAGNPRDETEIGNASTLLSRVIVKSTVRQIFNRFDGRE